MPSSFCPNLKDPVQELKLEGPANELEFAQFPEIKVDLPTAKFFNLSGSSSSQDASNNQPVSEQERNLQNHEYESNLQHKNNLIDSLNVKIKCLEDQIAR